ncbi:hypothetical protein FC83_GL001668 [Agrilactobacillus composti DSM 18527 = JCM 14202]|uniref:DUF3021 domain-containing protein n=1 Tax=Agrilactobacillus composti DSM 18527 = JCM 14202 TaxID=1423734 RepID=X0PNA0_9LACO|nr:DUF3021 domain-containing protein [Agrilactobacillus composti]KRM30533.1 hypothetical protein FC83_GL001668 [Agrilactobacillus composti DSM 18527 = JCM 14202]GAF38401.1 hypothetical protein JCM14202_208 [Agrilactobacillus composti DSM 18527 = JCM 14202]
MTHLKHVIHDVLFGIMVGATVYFGALALHFKLFPATAKNAAALLVTAGLIGLLSQLFEIEQFSFTTLFGIHCILTVLIVLGASYLFDWEFLAGSTGRFWLIFILIYAVIWIGWRLYSLMTVQALNVKIRKRNKSNK